MTLNFLFTGFFCARKDGVRGTEELRGCSTREVGLGVAEAGVFVG